MKRTFRYFRLKLTRKYFSFKKGGMVASCLFLALSLLFFFLFEYLFYSTSVFKVDKNEFTRTLKEKEAYSEQVLDQIKSTIESEGLTSLCQQKNIYNESEQKEISFQIYQGDQLEFWSNNVVALEGVSKFNFAKEFFYETDNSYVVVLQSFFREYRCVALIKIKDNIFPKKNSLNNHYAEAFHIPGSVIISKDKVDDEDSMSFSSQDGKHLFSLSNITIRHENPAYLIFSIVCWVLVLFAILLLLSSYLAYVEKWHPAQYKYSVVGTSLVWLLVIALTAIFRYPTMWFENDFLSTLSYHSTIAPTLSHLFLYTLFLYGMLFLFKSRIPTKIISPNTMSPLYAVLLILVLKTISFLLLIYLYEIIKGLVYHSNMNVAVSIIQEVRAETFLLLLLELFCVYLYYWFISRVKQFYADKSNTKIIIYTHLLLTTVSVVFFAVSGSWLEVVLLILVSCVILFIDLYETYYPISGFLYTAPIAFIFINLIVGLSYHYSSLKTEAQYKQMAQLISVENCVYQDDIAESILKEKNLFVITDSRLIRWVRLNSSETDELLETYLWESYFKVFEDKYDFEVQICSPHDSLYIRKPNFENAEYSGFDAVAPVLRKLDMTKFYANQDEKLAISYLGHIQMDSISVYLKFYRKTTYDRVSLLEQSIRQTTPFESNSKAKYLNGELSYSDGEFHYPILMSWLTAEEQYQTDYQFALNYYTHYVHVFDSGRSMSVVSVPERQSYIYVILTTYLFAAYVLIAILYFSIREIRKHLLKKSKSLLTRMQLLFVIPIMSAFLILAVATFPFFMDQYEKSQFSEIKEDAISVQQNVQNIVGLSDNLSDQSMELFTKVKELSNLFQLNVVLYDEDGKLLVSSRPLVMFADKRQSHLVYPIIKFQTVPELFRKEKVRSIDCYSHYVKAYNLQNKCVGYIRLMSHKAYYQVQNEIFNILVVVVDIYLFISIISIFIIWLLNKRTTKPLVMLSERFTEVRLTGENTLIDYPEDDEIGDLVKQYNNMVLQLQDSAERLARSEREFAWREMARRIAHEIKNPLTPMKLSVQQCMRKRALDPEHFDDYFQKTSKILIDQIDNLSNIASEFSSFAKAAESRYSAVDIVDKLQSTVELFANNSEDVSFRLNLNGYEHEYIWMDDKQLLQIFNNLFRNAIQSIPSNREGRVVVSFYEEENSTFVEITDNGCGISKENREKMFQPNFTTKTSGMGLGLAIVKNILLSAGGDIWFDSEMGKGTTFFVKIPIYHAKDNE